MLSCYKQSCEEEASDTLSMCLMLPTVLFELIQFLNGTSSLTHLARAQLGTLSLPWRLR